MSYSWVLTLHQDTLPFNEFPAFFEAPESLRAFLGPEEESLKKPLDLYKLFLKDDSEATQRELRKKPGWKLDEESLQGEFLDDIRLTSKQILYYQHLRYLQKPEQKPKNFEGQYVVEVGTAVCRLGLARAILPAVAMPTRFSAPRANPELPCASAELLQEQLRHLLAPTIDAQLQKFDESQKDRTGPTDVKFCLTLVLSAVAPATVARAVGRLCDLWAVPVRVLEAEACVAAAFGFFNAIVVDIGHSQTRVVPVLEGQADVCLAELIGVGTIALPQGVAGALGRVSGLCTPCKPPPEFDTAELPRGIAPPPQDLALWNGVLVPALRKQTDTCCAARAARAAVPTVLRFLRRYGELPVLLAGGGANDPEVRAYFDRELHAARAAAFSAKRPGGAGEQQREFKKGAPGHIVIPEPPADVLPSQLAFYGATVLLRAFAHMGVFPPSLAVREWDT
eukprot:gnl/Chilomastix_cuspidata/4417.p1 GENE.gnl/Chilomastix_cuspidata/4417~~gnl/Chilomastix_cuspidata/4417.p1  ORF type:complete len:451 (-),score=163.05 gnl/Chilomastix_cuspidata/4417:28-1380(-)